MFGENVVTQRHCAWGCGRSSYTVLNRNTRNNEAVMLKHNKIECQSTDVQFVNGRPFLEGRARGKRPNMEQSSSSLRSVSKIFSMWAVSFGTFSSRD